jgi:hypothetical protein
MEMWRLAHQERGRAFGTAVERGRSKRVPVFTQLTMLRKTHELRKEIGQRSEICSEICSGMSHVVQ